MNKWGECFSLLIGKSGPASIIGKAFFDRYDRDWEAEDFGSEQIFRKSQFKPRDIIHKRPSSRSENVV